MGPKKLKYNILSSKHSCSNCGKPIKQNVIDRKRDVPVHCYHCFLHIVKGLQTIVKRVKSGTKGVTFERRRSLSHSITQNVRKYK